MKHLNRRHFVLLAALVPLVAAAEDAPASAAEFAPVPAAEVVVADLLYVRRPVIVFADSPNDPAFIRQMEMLPRYYAELAARDVILIVDTDPANPSALRKKLRPRGSRWC